MHLGEQASGITYAMQRAAMRAAAHTCGGWFGTVAAIVIFEARSFTTIMGIVYVASSSLPKKP